MNSPSASNLASLGVTLLVSLLVIFYYRRGSYPAPDRYRTFFPRLWSCQLDGTVLWPVKFLLFHGLRRVVSVELAFWFVALCPVVYSILLHARYGQTAGKRLTRVRVVDFRTEGPITGWQALLRDGIPAAAFLAAAIYEGILMLVHGSTPAAVPAGAVPEAGWLLTCLTQLPIAWLALELLTMLANDKSRALQDLIAGTVVVRTNVEAAPTCQD